MNSDEELPEEFRDKVPEQISQDAPADEPTVLGDEYPAQTGTVGNGWLLFGLFVLVAVGVLLLIIFASGENASSSMMLLAHTRLSWCVRGSRQ